MSDLTTPTTVNPAAMPTAPAVAQAPANPAKIDAILCPRDYPAGLDGQDKLIARNKEFGPILGVKRVHSRLIPGERSFIVGDPTAQTGINFGSDHANAGQDQYDWHDRGDGVSYGTRVVDANAPAVDPEATAATMRANMKKNLEAAIKAISAKAETDRAPGESARLANLQRNLAVITQAEKAADAAHS